MAIEGYYLLTIDKGKLVCVYGPKSDRSKTIDSLDSYRSFLDAEAQRLGLGRRDQLTVMCSSSLDFPEDETDDERVIAMCRELRS